MTDTYVVVAQVGGFTKDNKAEKLAILERESDAHVVDSLIRDDGTGELCVVWKPETDPFDAQTFEAAKASIEDVRSAVTGAGLTHLNPVRVELRDVTKPARTAAKKTTKA